MQGDHEVEMCHGVARTEQKTQEVSEAHGRKKNPLLSTLKESSRQSWHVIVCWLANRALGKADIQTRLIGSESNDHMSSIQHDLNKHI